MLILYLFFNFGAKTSKKNKILLNSTSEFYEVVTERRVMSFTLAILFFFFGLIYIQYYTGQSPYNVILNVIIQNSNYESYQKYFLENELTSLSFKKIPYIFGFGIFKAIIGLMVIRLFGFQLKIKLLDYFYVIIIVLTFLYMAIGRGTTFEIMEIMILIIFSFILRLWRYGHRIKFSMKNKIIFIVLFVFSLMLFNNNIESRGAAGLRSFTNELYYKDNLLSSINPSLGILSFRLSGYFSFGLYFVSTLFYKITLSSVSGFTAFFIPFGTFMLGDVNYRDLICGVFIDCGVAWSPDIVLLLAYLGFFGSIVLMYGLGKFATKLAIRAFNGSITASFLLYYIVYYVFSLPVGNFISVSSSNKIAVSIALIIYFFPKRIFFLQKYLETKPIKI